MAVWIMVGWSQDTWLGAGSDTCRWLWAGTARGTRVLEELAVVAFLLSSAEIGTQGVLQPQKGVARSSWLCAGWGHSWGQRPFPGYARAVAQ